MQRILIAGEGGQGVQLIAEMLAKAVFKQGKHASYIPNFGVEQRGGVSLAFVILDTIAISYPKFYKADFVITMVERAKIRAERYISKQTEVYDSTEFDYQNLPNRVRNMFVLGFLAKHLDCASMDTIKQVLTDKIGAKFKKNPQLKEDNFKALDLGYAS